MSTFSEDLSTPPLPSFEEISGNAKAASSPTLAASPSGENYDLTNPWFGSMSRELGLSSTRGDRKASVTSRDQYGFEIGEGDSKEDGSEEEDSSKRRAKWVKVLNLLSNHEPEDVYKICCRWSTSSDNPPVGSASPSKSHSLSFLSLKSKLGLSSALEALGTKLNKMIRKGVPKEMRGQVWWLCSGGYLLASRAKENGEQSYDEIMERIKSAGVDSSGTLDLPLASEIEKDLRRTFPSNSHFNSQSGLSSLRSLLLAYSIRNPKVGYCQSMNFLSAFLLLNMDPPYAFWVLSSMVECLLPADYYSLHMVGSRSDQRVLLGCLSWKLPSLHSHLVSIGCASADDESVPMLEPLTCAWYLCVFVNSLPLSLALRVWDCFLHEGRKVLLRVGLSIMKTCQKALLEQGDIAGVYKVIRNNAVVSGEMQASELISMCYDKSWIGSFPHDRIDKMRTKYRLQVEKERDEIERRRKVREETRIRKEKERKEREEKERLEREQTEGEGDDGEEGDGVDLESNASSSCPSIDSPLPPATVLSTVASVDPGVIAKAGGELETRYAERKQSLVMLVQGGEGAGEGQDSLGSSED